MSVSPSRRGLLVSACAVAVGGCAFRDDDRDDDGDGEPGAKDGTDGADVEWQPPEEPPPGSVEVEPLATNLEIAWDVAFAPTGEAFVTEGMGRFIRFDAADLLGDAGPIDANDVPSDRRWILPGEDAMGVAAHPSYPEPAFVYVYVHEREECRVERFDAEAEVPRETRRTLVEGIDGNYTIGGRLAFGPGGDLWITVGTADGDPAQDPADLGGSILRVTPDGDPSDANPDLGGGDPRVYSYGHRNPQGLTWLPEGTPLCTDHGPEGRDELLLLRPGANYGWPDVRGGQADGEYERYEDREEVEPPLVHTGPDETWAPAGCVFVEGDALPSLRNRLLVATLAGRHLAVVTLAPPEGDPPPLGGEARRYDESWLDGAFTAASRRLLDDELGRLRHVAEGPDGSLLVLTSNRDGGPGPDEPFPRARDDAILRLVPSD